MTSKEFKQFKVVSMRMARSYPASALREKCLKYVRQLIGDMADPGCDIHHGYIENYVSSTRGPRESLCYFLSEDGEFFEWYSDLHIENTWGDLYHSPLMKCVEDCLQAACETVLGGTETPQRWTEWDLAQAWAPRKLPTWVRDGHTMYA